MRITVDINDETIAETLSLTGERTKSAAVGKAVDEFVRRRKAAEFGRLMREGAFNYDGEEVAEPAAAEPAPPFSAKRKR